MAISVNPLSYVISVPKADLTFVSGTLYTMNTDNFRLELKSWEDSEEGIIHPKTHNHNTTVEIVGITYARAISILAPYSVEFEDGQYTVVLEGSNNNIFDVAGGILVQNQVQVIPTNSGGLIQVTSGSGVTAQDKIDIANTVWQTATRTLTSFGTLVSDVWSSITRTLTSGTKDSEIDTILSKVNEVQTSIISILGLTGQNVQWSSIQHNAQNLMTGARITVYDDNTLTTPTKSWDITATYNGDGEILSYQMKEV